MKKLLFVLMCLMATPAMAAEPCSLDVKVNGLVCDFCAQALNKVFRKQEAVQDVKVDLDQGLVHIVLKDQQQLDDATVKQLITDSGYSVHHIEKDC